MLPYLLLPFLEFYNPYLFSPCGGNSGVIMGEFLVSKEGIGYLIMYGSQVFNLDLVMTGIFLLLVLSAILYYLVVFIEKRVNNG